ncbi:MAG: zinc dependent phospholipase C family protein [Bauldia sp.]
MPKFGSHIIFVEMARERRPELFVAAHENALRLGCIGPDTTLFLFDPATSNPDLRKGINTALEVLTTIQSISEKIDAITEPFDGPVEDLLNWVTGGLSSDLGYLINTSLDALFSVMKLGIVNAVGSINVKNPVYEHLGELPAAFITNSVHLNQFWTFFSADNVGFPFRMFGHPFTDDSPFRQPLPPGDYSEWWWMDMLHYRRTGQFASALIANANGPVQTSFAAGYMTHVAGDVCGHPFINTLVGGPFRNHVHRHLVVETLADTWLWADQGRGDILESRLDRLIQLEASEARQVADLVVATMRQVYPTAMAPKLLGGQYPTPDEFLSAYRLMQQYLRLSTAEVVKRPTPPPDTPLELIEELRDLLGNNVPSLPPSPGDDFLAFVLALLEWFAKGLTLLVMLLTLPAAAIIRIATLAPRWLIYFLNLGVYHIVSATRTMLCLTGWGYAGKDDFENFGFLEDWVTTPPVVLGSYPAINVPNPKPPFYWLTQPGPAGLNAPVEDAPTYPMAPWEEGLKPSWMVDPTNVMDPGALSFFTAPNPGRTRALEAQQRRLGNPVDFSIALLSGVIPVPDLDLDGDRGYGYRGWEVLPPNERYDE